MKGFSYVFDGLPVFYGEELTDKQKGDIKKQLDNNLKLLSREMIKNAVMMFIVRYLGGMRQEVDIGNDDLIIRLENREDIWDKEIFNNEQFKNEIEKFIPSRIKIRNIKSFYDICLKQKERFSKITMNEDIFICFNLQNDLKLITIDDAIKFSAENQTYCIYPKLYNKLPFGCHTRKAKYKLFDIFNIKIYN